MAQGQAPGTPTTLYQAVQGTGEITFVVEGTDDIGYNAMGFREADRFLYAINSANDNLVRIGQEGDTTGLGSAGLPSSGTLNYNQGTFGEGATADTLYVRLAGSNNSMYAVDVVSRTSRRIALQSNVPNVSDIVWKDGYIWGVYGEGQRLYRIDPSTGAVLSVPLPPGIAANPYGAQWVYGNGNIGISNNVTGTVYQLQVNDPTSGTPSVTLVSATRGPANTQNDGASSRGAPADLGITKEGPETWRAGDLITYTLRVHNYGPGDSSGYIVTDALPPNLGSPRTDTEGCAVVTEDGQNFVRCTKEALAAGEDGPVITITGTAPDTPGADCVADAITDTAEVLGNDYDENLTNNTDTSTACPVGETRPSFSVSKTASVSAPDSVGPGDTVTYTVTVTNTGTEDYTEENPASFTDDLRDVTDDAQVVPDSLTGGAELTDGGISWSGPLAVGESHTVTYTVRVNGPDEGNHVLRNAVAPGGTGSCASPEDCSVTTPVRQFTVEKTVSPDEAQAGDTVTYQVVVTNTGAAPFTVENPASFSDDLSDVLDDAEYNDDATGGATVTGTRLDWSGPLDVGEQVTITYSVTVDDPATGNMHLRNTVTPGPDGVCAAESACTSDVPVVTTPQEPSLSLEKRVESEGPFEVGDRVVYSYTVTNTGDTDLAALTVDDDRVTDVTCGESALAPGESTTCTGIYEITSASLEHCRKDGGQKVTRAALRTGHGDGACRLTNTATATATGPGGDGISSNTDQATITVEQKGGHHPPCKDHHHCHGKGHGGGHGHGHGHGQGNGHGHGQGHERAGAGSHRG